MPNMRAMILERPGLGLEMRAGPVPQPGNGEILVEVKACGVCRTDLHVVDGELPNPKLPIVPGHEIVGRAARICAMRRSSRAIPATAATPRIRSRTQIIVFRCRKGPTTSRMLRSCAPA